MTLSVNKIDDELYISDEKVVLCSLKGENKRDIRVILATDKLDGSDNYGFYRYGYWDDNRVKSHYCLSYTLIWTDVTVVAALEN
ncbi:MAG: hypothetical protein ACI9GH_000467 [Candidatus Paceibacteria bacterium]|jgi:hypothetical protein